MIQDTIMKVSGRPASTSDLWHVVHTKQTAESFVFARPLEQSIVSEHKTQDAAEAAASTLFHSLAGSMRSLPADASEKFVVRPPGFHSIKYYKERRRSVASSCRRAHTRIKLSN